ncbi:MAG: DUF86 domain-containing protein [Planctomycetaceae bacterium]|jgi:uncharacterized protein with HEPN domain|nr:DUF86 domain-containing protein [Planctomycetaceae bacterium]
MFAKIKNDLLYLLNILEHIGKIQKYTENANSPDEFYELNEQLNFNATINLLANIGENISKISNELKTEYPEIEWRQIKDFRNKIIHNYVGIDFILTYNIIKHDLKKLQPKFEEIIKTKLTEKIFDTEEINLCKNSKYYQHVRFEKII